MLWRLLSRLFLRRRLPNVTRLAKVCFVPPLQLKKAVLGPKRFAM